MVCHKTLFRHLYMCLLDMTRREKNRLSQCAGTGIAGSGDRTDAAAGLEPESAHRAAPEHAFRVLDAPTARSRQEGQIESTDRRVLLRKVMKDAVPGLDLRHA